MNNQPRRQVRLVVPRAQAARWIRDELKNGRELPGGTFFSGVPIATAIQKAADWLESVGWLLSRIFDTPDLADDWRALNFDKVNAQVNGSSKLQLFRRCRKDYVARLESISKRLRYIPEALPSQSIVQVSESEGSEPQVFIVHGHDEAAKAEAARFLMQLGLQPIILAEEPNNGRTIIEKLEASSDVAYAVVLLTPDDPGAAIVEDAVPMPRARQNVILELGYFIGLLGREFVCALHKDNVEIPSDYLGVVYVPFDDQGAWKPKLAQELNAAGIHVDLNKAYKLR